MSADPIWFYEQERERRGPVDAGTLLELHRSGTIGDPTLVWRDGLPDWIPFSASELALSGSKGRTPPPMPPVLSPAPRAMPNPGGLFMPRTARLRPGFTLRLGDAYGRAWRQMASRFWPSVGCFALTSILLGVASQFYAPLFFLLFPLMGGLCWYYLLHLRGGEASVETLFEGFRRQFGPLAILNLIVVGISSIAMILAMIPLVAGIVIGGEMLDSGSGDKVLPVVIIAGAVVLFFLLLIPILLFNQVGSLATILSLDCALPARESLSLAWAATRRHLGRFTLFMIANMALSFLGLLALYFGMFITGTWSTIALVQIYEDAFGDEPGA